jgi:ribonuclease E
MANKMLIDAAHPEETRVVVLRGNRVEEFDFETAQRKQLRGNIYLAKVTRVEPSLQAAFVEYGGNRHGFLAFSEIHPDYYQIPVADRQALIDAEARADRDYEEDEERGSRGRGRRRGREHRRRDRGDDTRRSEPVAEGAGHDSGEHAAGLEAADNFTADPGAEPNVASGYETAPEHDRVADAPAAAPADASGEPQQPEPQPDATAGHDAATEAAPPVTAAETVYSTEPVIAEAANPPVPGEIATEDHAAGEPEADGASPAETHDASATPAGDADDSDHGHDDANGDEEEEVVESVGGADALEEVPDRAPRHHRRPYKIQEVIKRRQVMLVQVVKEERGTKGAALTTYLSLAGRYCVLMPNTARGGGISRKITSADDRKKLREIAEELDVPDGMGVILRTAGAARTKQEVKRDFEYLLRLWEQVRDLTLKSTAPELVYEEGSLAKRSIRDLYSRDIEEIVVAGESGYRDAKDFMRMLMPSHAQNVKHYNDTQPIFTRYGIESQLDAMFSPTVQLRSGGYIVINQTEALVAIDVNSGRSTREHHIEDTALKTNCEAAEEIARQLRLRDLAGLIVIDFIDMDEKRNNRTVERRMKDALRNDRARIQVGRISHFGLLEMSRQRIRTSVLESSTDKCPHCGGTGHMRSVSSVALQLLRSVEETLLKGATHNQIVRTRPEIALYVLNHKRAHLMTLEDRFRVTITIDSDAEIGGQPGFAIERGEQVMSAEQAKAIAAQAHAALPPPAVEDEPEAVAEEFADEERIDDAAGETAIPSGEAPEFAGEASGEPRDGRRRRRRRGRGRGGERREHGEHRDEHREHNAFQAGDGEPATDDAAPAEQRADHAPGETGHEASDDDRNGDGRRRRRGRRGGRRNRRSREGGPAGNGGDQPHADFSGFDDIDTPPGGAQQDGNGPDASARSVMTEPAGERPAAHRTEREPAPDPHPISAPPAAEVPAEPPRRRSTVREPAPVFAAGASAASAEPSPPSTPTPDIGGASPDNTESETRPRRTGWWAKRLLGGDKS